MTLEERKVSKYNTFQLVFYPNFSNRVQLTWIIADCETEDSKNSLKICDAIPQFFSTDLSRFIHKWCFKFLPILLQSYNYIHDSREQWEKSINDIVIDFFSFFPHNSPKKVIHPYHSSNCQLLLWKSFWKFSKNFSNSLKFNFSIRNFSCGFFFYNL